MIIKMNKAKIKRFITVIALCISMSLQCCPVFAGENLLQDAGFEVKTDGSGLDVGTAVYRDGSDEFLSDIPAGDTVKSSVNMKNTSSEAKNVSVITALYNGDNAMKDISAKNVSLGAGKKTTVENTLDIPPDAGSGWCIRTYILENFGNMYSYCESFSFPPEPVKETVWNMGDAFKLSSEKLYSGYSSLKIDGKTSECSQPIAVNKNSMYKMSFFGVGDSNFSYGIFDDTDAPVAEEKTFEACDEWTLNSLLFKTSDIESALIKFRSNGSGKAFVDDVSVSDDILVNGDFESGSTGWVLDENCFEISKTEAYDGKRSLKITSNAAGSVAYQETEVLAHSKGMIYFKSKCSEKINLKILDAQSNELISKVGTTVDVSSSWKDNHIYINTLGYDKVRLCFETTGSSSKVSYIDNVEFTNLTYADEIVNSDFENSAEGWNTAYSSVTTSDDAFSGESCALLTDRTRVYSNISQKVTDILNRYGPGEYYLEAYIKPQYDITGGWIVSRVVYTPKGGAETKKNISLSNPKSEWNKLSGIVELTWDTEVSSAVIQFETSQRTEDSALLGDLFIDDVSFFKMPD